MSEKRVKTRKAHACCYCGKKIEKGEKASFFKERQARHNEEDEQVGIEYVSNYMHPSVAECLASLGATPEQINAFGNEMHPIDYMNLLKGGTP